MPKGKAAVRKQPQAAGAAAVTTTAHVPLPGPPDAATHAAYQRMEAAFRRELQLNEGKKDLWSVWPMLCQYDGSKHARIALGLTFSRLLALYEFHPATITISLFLKRTLLLSGVHLHAYQQLLTYDILPNRDNCACLSLLAVALSSDITPDRLKEIPPEDCQPEPWQRYESLAYMNWHPKAITLACKALTPSDTQTRLAAKKFLLRLLIPHELASRRAFDAADFPSHVLREFCETVLSDKVCLRAIFALLQEPDTLHVGILVLDAVSISKEDLLGDNNVTFLSTLRHMLDCGAAKALTSALNHLRTRLEQQQRQGVQSPHGLDELGSPEFCMEMMCTLLQVIHGSAAADKMYWHDKSKQERVRPGPAWPEELIEAHLKAFFKAVENGRLNVSCLAVYPEASLPIAAHVFNRLPAMTKTFVEQLKTMCVQPSKPDPDLNNMGLTAQLYHDLCLAGHGTGAKMRLPDIAAELHSVAFTVRALLSLSTRLQELGEEAGPEWRPSDTCPIVRNMSRVLQLLLCLLVMSETARKHFALPAPPTPWPQRSLALALGLKRSGLEQAAFDHEERLVRRVMGCAPGAGRGDPLACAPFSSWYPPALRAAGWDVDSSSACSNGGAGHSTQSSPAEIRSVGGAEVSGKASGSSRRQDGRRPSSVRGPSGAAGASDSCSTDGSGGGGAKSSQGKRCGSRPDRVCAACGKVGKLKACSRCEAAFFCGPDCQRVAWPTHQTVCAPRQHTTASQ